MNVVPFEPPQNSYLFELHVYFKSAPAACFTFETEDEVNAVADDLMKRVTGPFVPSIYTFNSMAMRNVLVTDQVAGVAIVSGAERARIRDRIAKNLSGVAPYPQY